MPDMLEKLVAHHRTGSKKRRLEAKLAMYADYKDSA
jgi:hypothetical protein